MTYKKTTFKNGLRIITVPQKNTQAVTVLVLVKTGSKYEKKEINGISHFLEHMCFKGTKKFPSPVAVAEVMDRVGGIYNAFTDQEYTGYFAKVEASQFGLAFDWVSELFLNPLLPKEEIEKEKKVIVEEINMIHDNPMSYIGVLWLKLLYGDQPAGWDIAGEKETVMKIDREKLINYRENQYVPLNTLICIAGNFPQEDAQRLIRKYFSKLKPRPSLKKEKVIEKQEKPAVLLKEKETDQTHLILGVRGYNLFHPLRYAKEILSIILGGMMSSRLFVKVRGKLGLAYYINSDVEQNPDTGYLFIRTGVDNNRVELAISTILKEIKKIREKRVSISELKKAKENLKGRLALLLESSDAQASFFGLQELLENRILSLKEIYKEIDKVNQNAILKVARDIFKPEKLNLALIGPFKDKNIFERILKL
jgi:predicted Zn-dependent peptidase